MKKDARIGDDPAVTPLASCRPNRPCDSDLENLSQAIDRELRRRVAMTVGLPELVAQQPAKRWQSTRRWTGVLAPLNHVTGLGNRRERRRAA